MVYNNMQIANLVMFRSMNMTTSDMIVEVCKNMNISIAELARRINQSPQNLNKKLKRGTVSAKEMIAIAQVLDITYEQRFILNDGTIIRYGN